MEPVLGGEAQEVVTILAGVGGDAADLPFLEQVLLVMQCGDVAQVNAGQRESAAAV